VNNIFVIFYTIVIHTPLFVCHIHWFYQAAKLWKNWKVYINL